MKRIKLPEAGLKLGLRFQPELNVVAYVSTKRGDPERGPVARMCLAEARLRLVQDGELVRVAGPRRDELAVLVVDDSIPEGRVALRDVAGVTVSESVTITRPDTDTPLGGRHLA